LKDTLRQAHGILAAAEPRTAFGQRNRAHVAQR
jgi:hypothetical protein